MFSNRLLAQETTQKRGAVKGTVSLVNASLGRPRSNGLLVELKPLAEGAASLTLTAVTDAAGNYGFKDLAAGDYTLRLHTEGFGPFTATIHVQDGISIAQTISVRLTELAQRIEVKEQAEPLSTASSSASNLSEKQLASLPLAEENFKASLLEKAARPSSALVPGSSTTAFRCSQRISMQTRHASSASTT